MLKPIAAITLFLKSFILTPKTIQGGYHSLCNQSGCQMQSQGNLLKLSSFISFNQSFPSIPMADVYMFSYQNIFSSAFDLRVDSTNLLGLYFTFYTLSSNDKGTPTEIKVGWIASNDSRLLIFQFDGQKVTKNVQQQVNFPNNMKVQPYISVLLKRAYSQNNSVYITWPTQSSTSFSYEMLKSTQNFTYLVLATLPKLDQNQGKYLHLYTGFFSGEITKPQIWNKLQMQIEFFETTFVFQSVGLSGFTGSLIKSPSTTNFVIDQTSNDNITFSMTLKFPFQLYQFEYTQVLIVEGISRQTSDVSDNFFEYQLNSSVYSNDKSILRCQMIFPSNYEIKFNGSCGCGINQFYDSKGQKCVDCNKTCMTCSGYDKCLSCASGYSLANKQNLTFCEKFTFPNFPSTRLADKINLNQANCSQYQFLSNNICQECSIDCLSCQGSYQNCTKCENDKELYQFNQSVSKCRKRSQNNTNSSAIDNATQNTNNSIKTVNSSNQTEPFSIQSNSILSLNVNKSNSTSEVVANTSNQSLNNISSGGNIKNNNTQKTKQGSTGKDSTIIQQSPDIDKCFLHCNKLHSSLQLNEMICFCSENQTIQWTFTTDQGDLIDITVENYSHITIHEYFSALELKTKIKGMHKILKVSGEAQFEQFCLFLISTNLKEENKTKVCYDRYIPQKDIPQSQQDSMEVLSHTRDYVETNEIASMNLLGLFASFQKCTQVIAQLQFLDYIVQPLVYELERVLTTWTINRAVPKWEDIESNNTLSFFKILVKLYVTTQSDPQVSSLAKFKRVVFTKNIIINLEESVLVIGFGLVVIFLSTRCQSKQNDRDQELESIIMDIKTNQQIKTEQINQIAQPSFKNIAFQIFLSVVEGKLCMFILTTFLLFMDNLGGISLFGIISVLVLIFSSIMLISNHIFSAWYIVARFQQILKRDQEVGVSIEQWRAIKLIQVNQLKQKYLYFLSGKRLSNRLQYLSIFVFFFYKWIFGMVIVVLYGNVITQLSILLVLSALKFLYLLLSHVYLNRSVHILCIVGTGLTVCVIASKFADFYLLRNILDSSTISDTQLREWIDRAWITFSFEIIFLIAFIAKFLLFQVLNTIYNKRKFRTKLTALVIPSSKEENPQEDVNQTVPVQPEQSIQVQPQFIYQEDEYIVYDFD